MMMRAMALTLMTEAKVMKATVMTIVLLLMMMMMMMMMMMLMVLCLWFLCCHVCLNTPPSVDQPY